MLVRREQFGNEEDEPHPDRWWLVTNVIAGYALTDSGMLQPDTHTFLVKSPEEDMVRSTLGAQFPTIDFKDQPLAVYPLSGRTPAALDYEAPYTQDVIEIRKDHDLL